MTVWFDASVVEVWSASRRNTRGGQRRYSDLAIEICFTLRSVFRPALRQTQGLTRSLIALLGLDLAVPEFSTLSRRAATLNIATISRSGDGPITLIVDGTGLKVHSDESWHDHKHGPRKSRKTWRKLHIALDPDSGQILASDLTTEHVGDTTALVNLILDRDVPVGRVIADGAYDGQPVFELLNKAFGPDVEIDIPQPTYSVLGLNDQRDRHIQSIAKDGRMGWQKQSGDHQRSKVEAQIERRQEIIGAKLHGRGLETQKSEIQIAEKALNRMTDLGRAVFERVA